jgi:transposase
VVSVQPRPWPKPADAIVAAVRAKYARRPVPLAVQVRDRLGELYPDAEFASAFGDRGRPGWSPGRLALVTVLQLAENLTDRQAAEAARTRIDWMYALGLDLDDPGFDHSVLCEFRTRVVTHGLEEKVLDLLLARVAAEGLLGPGGKQRTDATHVVAAVRDLNRLELAGESVRACVEALAVAAPTWLAGVIDVPAWSKRYGVRVDSWRLPSSEAKREALALAYARDGYALVEACYRADAPAWLREVEAVQILRVVLLQNFTRTVTEAGVEVTRRQADRTGLPPGRFRLSSPYDPDARWGGKGDTVWNGYKVHLTETCDAADTTSGDTTSGDTTSGDTTSGDTTSGDTTSGDGLGGSRPEPATATTPAPPGRGVRPARPNLITNVATTDATVPDSAMTAPIHRSLAARALLPAEHYVDAGYPSAKLVADAARDHGIALISPMLADTSRQARAGAGYAAAAFRIDWDAQQALCPQGMASSSWSPATQRGTEAIVVKFPAQACGACPVRDHCTTATRGGRQLTLKPRLLHETLQANRAEQDTTGWQARYAVRAGVEGTMHQAIAVTGTRNARYRGRPKTHFEHVFSAVALNLLRLDAWWNGRPADRTRSSHLTRLERRLAA